MHSIESESIIVKGSENTLFAGMQMHFFSLEILQAGAVKVLNLLPSTLRTNIISNMSQHFSKDQPSFHSTGCAASALAAVVLTAHDRLTRSVNRPCSGVLTCLTAPSQA